MKRLMTEEFYFLSEYIVYIKKCIIFVNYKRKKKPRKSPPKMPKRGLKVISMLQ